MDFLLDVIPKWLEKVMYEQKTNTGGKIIPTEWKINIILKLIGWLNPFYF